MSDPKSLPPAENPGESAPKKPTSTAKVEANRRNARRSTGPNTPRGKKHSSRNAIKHGLLAKEVLITIGPGKENEEEFKALLAGIRNSRRPVGILEDLYVQEIAISYVRSLRALRSERGAVALGNAETCQNPNLTELDHLVLRTMSDADARFDLQQSSRGLNYLLQRTEDIKKEVRSNGFISPESRWVLRPAEVWSCYSSKKVILAALENEIQEPADRKTQIEKDELHQRNATVDFASIPPKVSLDSIHRYETSNVRTRRQAEAALDRLQDQRRRENAKTGSEMDCDAERAREAYKPAAIGSSARQRTKPRVIDARRSV